MEEWRRRRSKRRSAATGAAAAAAASKYLEEVALITSYLFTTLWLPVAAGSTNRRVSFSPAFELRGRFLSRWKRVVGVVVRWSFGAGVFLCVHGRRAGVRVDERSGPEQQQQLSTAR